MGASALWRLALAGLVAATLGLATGAPVSGQASRVEQSEQAFVLRLRAPLAEVLQALEAAIAQHNYVLTRTNHLDDALRRRAATLGERIGFEHYKVVSYCNLTLADAALRAEPALGAFMPCRLAVYVPEGSREVVIVTIRPTFLMRAFAAPEIRRLAEQVEADTLAILGMVAGE